MFRLLSNGGEAIRTVATFWQVARPLWLDNWATVVYVCKGPSQDHVLNSPEKVGFPLNQLINAYIKYLGVSRIF